MTSQDSSGHAARGNDFQRTLCSMNLVQGGRHDATRWQRAAAWAWAAKLCQDAASVSCARCACSLCDSEMLFDQGAAYLTVLVKGEGAYKRDMKASGSGN